MELITILEGSVKLNHQRNWYIFLSIQKFYVEKHFNWLELNISEGTRSLIGKGVLIMDSKKHTVLLSYSPFNAFRYDRIYLDDKSIKYHKDIHLYADLSLCLYHPIVDQSVLKKLPLFSIIPWITEWIIFYEQWKKYGVWLGKEIKH